MNNNCCMVLKIVGVSVYNGISRNGKPYVLKSLEVDFSGEKVRIKCFDENVEIGDYVQIGFGVRKNVYGSELMACVEKIIPAAEIENNWK